MISTTIDNILCFLGPHEIPSGSWDFLDFRRIYMKQLYAGEFHDHTEKLDKQIDALTQKHSEALGKKKLWPKSQPSLISTKQGLRWT